MLFRLGLSDNREVTVKSEKDPNALAEWINAVCGELGFVACETPNTQDLILGVIFSPSWYPRRKRGRHHRTRPGQQVKMNRKEQ